MRPSRSAVLLDLDGTLVDPAAGIFASVRHALVTLDHPPLTEAELRSFIGPPIQDWFTAHGLDAERGVAAYREYYTDSGIFELTVYPGIPELLAALTEQGVGLALATSKPRVFARRIVDHLGLATLVPHVCGPELDGTNRHKADAVRLALERLQVTDPTAAVMLGDRVHDVVGARARGVDTIGALWGYGEPGELDGAWALAAGPADVLSLI